MKRALPILTLFALWASAHGTAPAVNGEALEAGVCCTENPVSLVPAYVAVADALAHDDLQGAIDAAENLGLWAECSEEKILDRAVADLERSRNLAEARIAFREISQEVIPLARWIPGHHVMSCPMAKADWIQIDAAISNPYYGLSMLRCGTIKESIDR